MKNIHSHRFQSSVASISIGLLVATTFAFAQDQPMAPMAPSQQQTSNPNGGWRRVGDPPTAAAPYDNLPAAPANEQGDPNQPPPPPPNGGTYGQAPNNQPAYPQPTYNSSGSYQQPGYGQQAPYNQPSYQPPPSIPARLTIPADTFITVRVNQALSSDTNQPGDAFSATLVQPVVVNGVVVAEPGQTLGGRVVEALKAGRVEGVARLGIQLTTLSLVDGQQISIESQLINRSGPTSVGQDVGTVATTTALGAAIGAAADWGRGAAIGAGAGAAAGLIGVLVTRGHPSVIHPEQVLTFRLVTPVTFSTANAPQAFRYIQPNEYDRPFYSSAPQGPGPAVYGAPAPVYAYPYYGYPYYGFPYYWGPGFSFYFGPSFYGRGWYGGYRGFYGGRYYTGHGFVGTGVRGGVAGGFHGSASGGGRR